MYRERIDECDGHSTSYPILDTFLLRKNSEETLELAIGVLLVSSSDSEEWGIVSRTDHQARIIIPSKVISMKRQLDHRPWTRANQIPDRKNNLIETPMEIAIAIDSPITLAKHLQEG